MLQIIGLVVILGLILIIQIKINKTKVDEVVTRAKALIIDEDSNILLGYCDNSYQFPGGHLEKGETTLECLIREVKEETGISLTKDEVVHFMNINTFTKNYRNSNKNRLNKIEYFLVKTGKKPNLNETNYVKEEIEGNYVLKEVNLDDIEEVLRDNISKNEINKLIVKEMIKVIKEYKKGVRNGKL